MPPPRAVVTRFAPSPTGQLHLGHAYSAGLNWLRAQAAGGRFLLRIEDIDQARCRPELVQGMLEDLHWLGLRWEQPVRRQSEHFPYYARHLDSLRQRGLLYPCFCTRRQVQEEVARMGVAPDGIEGPIYPGTCRRLHHTEQQARIAAGESHAWRLDMAAATAGLTAPLAWRDETMGDQLTSAEFLCMQVGDVVLARKDTPASYHLCVTLDDALQGITLVIRGEDLAAATHIHRLLQALFDLPTPAYAHHRLLQDDDGRRLAKRRDSRSLRAMRADGLAAAELWRDLGFDPAAFGV